MNTDIGMELKLNRVARKLSLKKAAKMLDISESFLSEIERNLKIPSEEVLRKLAEFYSIDEVYLFDKYGKISLTIAEELRGNKELQETLFQISKDKKLSNEEKEAIYEGIQNLYKEVLKKK